MELYNEQLSDLLIDTNGTANLRIYDDHKRSVDMPDLKEIDPYPSKQIRSL